MARRSPARTRADTHRRRAPHERIAIVSGVSPRGQAEIARLERTRWHPGAVADALRSWERYARESPAAEGDLLGCGISGCCPDPFEERELLEAAVHALPTTTAAILRKRLIMSDDLVEDWRVITDS